MKRVISPLSLWIYITAFSAVCILLLWDSWPHGVYLPREEPIHLVAFDPTSGLYQEKVESSQVLPGDSHPTFGVDADNKPVRLKGMFYPNAICVWPGTEISFFLGEKYKNLFGRIGILDSPKVPKNFEFTAEILSDGEVVWSNFKPRNGADGKKKSTSFLITVDGVSSVTLRVAPLAGELTRRQVCWLNTGIR